MNSPLKISLDDQLLTQIIDVWYAKMRDDYRINRYFYDRPLAEQAAPLKRLLSALLTVQPVEPQTLSELADAAFTAAFARGNAKPSLVNNRDFAFLGTLMNGNIVGDDSEVPRLTMLCPAHSHFLRLNPIDEVYDVAVELLQATLAQLNVGNEIAAPLIRLVASGKDSVMGRGEPIFDDEERSSRFSTHG
ncbi:hypothetical protein NP603_15300 [Methylomonas sp. SURF-1]|uniref:RsbT co-antagonist protein RsbRD N-terminal domain-containing protein n=1 Tax=Methylomonas aurea TaxID=2952224 RepID=A0ABT1UK40_9GAMM|nr:hypothetical protein [Methylomonas sp. SURF-1]MCQ8182487.1 hypothetical protein [Methylomonas sp. SURF-1]